MKKIVIALTLATLTAAPAMAGYRLMSKGQAEPVGKLGLVVTPGDDWNRLGAKIGRNAESWTLDGLPLNDLSFYAGIVSGQPLFREVAKKERPLPHFSATMLPTDIVQLFEGSYRVAAQTSLFTIDKVEPTTFVGRAGVHFTYTFTVQGEEVKRRGEATAAIVDSKLYMITFEAPVIHYFDRDIDKARAVMTSARLG